MCNEYDYNNNRPLGLQEAENAWNERQRKASTAMISDIYTNGGILDRINAMGYEQPMLYPSTIQQILERDFSYEELKFIAGARLPNMSMADIDRFISLLEKLKKCIKNIPANGLPTPVTPSTPSWNTPYYDGFGGGVQPSYPMEIPKEWMGETPSDISRRQMGTDDFTALINDDVQKGPNEPDESVNNKPINMLAELAAHGISIPPEPEFKNRTSKSSRVVLSAEGTSSKDDVQKGLNETEDETEKKQKEFTEMLYRSAYGAPGPIEPGQLKDVSLKAILDYPSTEDNKNSDEENKD